MSPTIIELLGTLTFTDAQEGSIGFGTLGGHLLLSEPNGRWNLPNNDRVTFSRNRGSVGYGLLGRVFIVIRMPAITSDRSFDEIGWHISEPMGSLGYVTWVETCFFQLNHR